MDLSQISNSELLLRLEKLAGTERKLDQIILWHINEVEQRKLFAELGYSSMYDYLTRCLKYSESCAYRKMQAARLLKANPQINDKIKDGTLTLSQLTKIQTEIKRKEKSGAKVSAETTKSLLEQIENKNLFETEKIIASELNLTPQMHQKVKPQQDDSVRLEITLTREQYEVLQKAQSLISHSVVSSSISDAIVYLAEKHIQKVEGKAAERTLDAEILVADKSSNNCESRVDPKSDSASMMTRDFCKVQSKRRFISLKTKRQLHLKADNCCEYQDPKSKMKCRSQFQLQIDHRVPLAMGGSNEPENLRVLCRTHNLSEARRLGLCGL